MKRNRHYHNLSAAGQFAELLDRVGQHSFEDRSRRNYPVILQEVDQSPQRFGVLAKRHGAIELGLELMATLAAAVTHQQLRRQQPFALKALWSTNRLDRIETILTNWKPGDVGEGETTEPAIGGKENRENTADYGQQRRDEGSTLLGALRSSLSV
jgi:hypothetical protein